MVSVLISIWSVVCGLLSVAGRWAVVLYYALYEPGELGGQQYGGGRRKQSTDPIWLVDVYETKNSHVQKHQPTLYHLDGGSKQSFTFKKLQPIQDP